MKQGQIWQFNQTANQSREKIVRGGVKECEWKSVKRCDDEKKEKERKKEELTVWERWQSEIKNREINEKQREKFWREE